MAELQRTIQQLMGVVTTLQRNQQIQTPPGVVPVKPVPPVAPPSAGVHRQPEIVDIYAEEEDLAEDDLRSFAFDVHNAAQLQDGIQAMTGEVHTSPALPLLSRGIPSGVPTSANFLDGPRLSDDLARARTEYSAGVEVTLDQLNAGIVSPDGIFLMTISGIPLTIAHAVSHKAPLGQQKIITRRYNPDNDGVITRTPAQQITPHAFPVGSEQLIALFRDQLTQALAPSPLFRGTAPTTLINAIIAYERKILRLIDGLYGGHTSAVIQAHQHHVTIWSVVALFHHNRWMRAMVHGNIHELLDGFDTTWQTVYAVQLGVDASGLPLIQLQEALTLLGYRCPRCNRLGACAVFCTHDTCRASIAARSVPDRKTYPPGYMKAYRAWRSTQAGLADGPEAHKKYAGSSDYKSHNFTEPTKGQSKSSSTRTLESCQEAANSQQHIRLHICPNFHY